MHTSATIRLASAGIARLAILLGTAVATFGAGAATSVAGASGTTPLLATAVIGAAAATTAAGRTPGQFGVTHSGAASYRVPLWMPPGVGDVQLDLALVYNSRGGNGTLGTGWSLAGLSTISRCNRTVAQDGVARGVAHVASDRFCLDGHPLKLASGSHGVAGSTYATELETFSRIVANGTAGEGPASFTVTTRNGLIYEYGGTADSRVHAAPGSATVRTWALSRVRDRTGIGTGNSIALTYQNEAQPGAYTNGTQRIATIAYPTTATGAGPFYEVKFDYSLRPAGDVPSGYRLGSVTREPYQLDAISVHTAGVTDPIRSYRLGYSNSPSTGRIRLTSVQECAATRCLAPSLVAYRDAANGWQPMREAGVSASPDRPPLVIDLDGDGMTDLLYPVSAGNGNLRWRILPGTASGYGTAVETGLVTAAATSAIVAGDFAGTGRKQFLVQQAGTWHLAGYGANGFVIANTGLVPGGEYGAADVDGDGLDDLVAQTSGAVPTITVRRNLTTPARGVVAAQFAANAQTIWSLPTTRVIRAWNNPRVADIDGDGRADVVVLTANKMERGVKYFALPLLSRGFDAPFVVGAERQMQLDSMTATGDWNADGCTDVLQVYRVYVSNCAGAFHEIVTTATVATGDGLWTLIPADWNADGRTDLLYVNGQNMEWHVVPSTGAGAGPAIRTGVPAPKQTAWFVHDADGDGLVDLGFRDSGSGDKLRYRLHAAPGNPPDLAASFTDGFGLRQTPTYVSIARSHHTRHSDAQFPEADFQGPLYVVSEFTASDGRGGTYRNELRYAGARRHLQGRGLEGFHSQRIQDSRTGLVTVDVVRREFPYTGMHVGRTVQQLDGSSVSSWVATPAQRVSGGSGSERRIFPHLASTRLEQYEIAGAARGTIVTEALTAYTYGDAFGNPTGIEATVTDEDPSSPFHGTSWQSTTALTYVNDASSSWCLGVPSSSTVTSEAPGQAAITRSTSYAVDAQACRITQRIVEPAGPALKVVTTYGYDGCGNLSSLRIVGSHPNGSAMGPRTTTFDYGARCQLPETITNPSGHSRTVAWRYELGVPTTSTDANGLATLWLHDEFGHPLQETRPDQTRTAWSYESCTAGPCWGALDYRFAVHESALDGAGNLVRSRESYFDGLDRLRSDQADGALGAWVKVDYVYDAAGRLAQVSRPYSTGSNGHSLRTYDALGRLTTRKLVDAGGAAARTESIGYSGRSTQVTDALGHARTLIHDVDGRLRRVTDPAPGGTTRYDYDPTGHLVRVQDPLGGTSTAIYNARGFRTRWTDADAGTWTFSANSLDELVGWTDAKGQSFTAAYDALGRRVSRTEPEGTATWTWGNSPTQRNVGRLVSKAAPGYAESYTYDPVGRLASQSIVTDQAYRYDYSYNAQGLLDTLSFPASPVPTGQSGTRFRVRYSYGHGLPTGIDDVTTSQPRKLWQLGLENDDGLPALETLGDGVASLTSSFDPVTGERTQRRAGAGGNPALHQDLHYEWDAGGNLKERRDARRNLTEAFQYDALDRLTTGSLNGTANLAVTYDAAGNLRHKSDVGAYAYGHPTKPNAVTSAGAESFTYDANGNVASRNGAWQQWASFNLPTRLQDSGAQTQFAYGPDRQRWRQVASYANGTETTHYVRNLLEKEHTTASGVSYWRHYVPTPGGTTVVVSRNTNGSAGTTWLLNDHLGSPETLLDAAGTVRARTSFTAFGARRGGDWSASTAPDWSGIANSSRQGFTGHEMLDNVGLVHMGGRVYDPGLGRFLSVDPLIGDAGDSQSVNPYAYVGNRPTRDVDSTGLVADGCTASCAYILATVFRSVFSLFGGTDPTQFLPDATAIPGPSAQGETGMCGPGTFSPTCGGTILYAGTPSVHHGSSNAPWGPGSQDEYAEENLEGFFIDLGVNAVDEILLSPIYSARESWDALRRGEHRVAATAAATAACDVAKSCDALKAATLGIRRLSKYARRASHTGSEVVQRAMSKAELDATIQTGLLRGGRKGTHFASDSVNSTARKARQRLALPTDPEVRVTLEVPRGRFSEPATVAPFELPNGKVLRGGGSERTAVGDVPVRVLRVDEF